MVEIKRIDDAKTLSKMGASTGELAFAAMSDGEVTGHCLYRLETGRVVIEELYERGGDMLLADCIVRAVAAANRDYADIVVISDKGEMDEYRLFLGLGKSEIAIDDFLKTNCR